ncbi:MAG: histidine phosphotransferase family protein [Paracoccaceae bacterium]
MSEGPCPRPGPAPAGAPDIPALVASRICHDLINPLGAIGNGVELLSLDRAAPSAELALVAESVTNASARLRFFRIAFGHARADQPTQPGEIAPILADLGRGGRVAYGWNVLGSVSRTDAKLAFLAILCLETALPYGGTIAATRDASGWRIAALGRGLRYESNIWTPLRRAGAALPPGEMTGLLPAHVQFALFTQEALAQDRRIALDLGESEGVVRF